MKPTLTLLAALLLASQNLADLAAYLETYTIESK